jgi:hypothetical protein
LSCAFYEPKTLAQEAWRQLTVLADRILTFVQQCGSDSSFFLIVVHHGFQQIKKLLFSFGAVLGFVDQSAASFFA